MTTRILVGHVLDRLRELPAESVHCCVTSPPYYGLRSYGIPSQLWPDGWLGDLGLEPTPALYIEHMVAVFRAVRRVLRKDGTLWLNIGDSYAGHKGYRPAHASTSTLTGGKNHIGLGRGAPIPDGVKPKDLLGIPWMLAFALRDDGWYLRSEITWAKRAAMPESVTDRPTSATEKVFLLSRSSRYFYDAEAVKEEAESDHPSGNGFKREERLTYADADGPRGSEQQWDQVGGKRNMRNFWLLGPEPFAAAHFATFPTEIPRRAIIAGSSERGVCPKCGAPWGRDIEKIGGPRGDHTKAGRTDGADTAVRETGRSGRAAGTVLSARYREHGVPEFKTVGWLPTCNCDACDDHPRESWGPFRPKPATVLDPFLGAGTTALVADQIGRDCIGIEMNQAYAAMAEQRLRDDAGMFADIAAD